MICPPTRRLIACRPRCIPKSGSKRSLRVQRHFALQVSRKRNAPAALTLVTNVTDQPLFGQKDYKIWPQLSNALLQGR